MTTIELILTVYKGLHMVRDDRHVPVFMDSCFVQCIETLEGSQFIGSEWIYSRLL